MRLWGKVATEAEETRQFVSLDSQPLRTGFNGGPQNFVTLKEISVNHVCDLCNCACVNCRLLWYLIVLFGATGRDLITTKKDILYLVPSKFKLFYLSFLHGSTATSMPRLPYYRGLTITLRDTTLVRAPLDQWSAQTSTWQKTTFTRDRHQCSRRGSKPQSQQASVSSPKP